MRPDVAAQRAVSDVGHGLNVAAVLSGSVYFAEGRVRVNVDLTETSTAVNHPNRVDEHRRRSQDAAYRAIELDPQMHEARHALGLLRQSEHAWMEAESELLKAGGVDLPPDEADAFAGLHMQTGRFDIVEFDLLEAARIADPRNEVRHRAVAFVHDRAQRARGSA